MNQTVEARRTLDTIRRQQLGLPEHNEGHGYESRYKHGCRCQPCRQAANTARNRRRDQEKQQRTCQHCNTAFRWPGLLDHHHATRQCGNPLA